MASEGSRYGRPQSSELLQAQPTASAATLRPPATYRESFCGAGVSAAEPCCSTGSGRGCRVHNPPPGAHRREVCVGARRAAAGGLYRIQQPTVYLDRCYWRHINGGDTPGGHQRRHPHRQLADAVAVHPAGGAGPGPHHRHQDLAALPAPRTAGTRQRGVQAGGRSAGPGAVCLRPGGGGCAPRARAQGRRQVGRTTIRVRLPAPFRCNPCDVAAVTGTDSQEQWQRARLQKSENRGGKLLPARGCQPTAVIITAVE
mmetsp:Transcript_876/g.2699  ORF Transcript_876/g.2699 Transcript_876/m.2699 type:complete len:257 (+) Transcript_876:687-1457(+)